MRFKCKLLFFHESLNDLHFVLCLRNAYFSSSMRNSIRLYHFDSWFDYGDILLVYCINDKFPLFCSRIELDRNFSFWNATLEKAMWLIQRARKFFLIFLAVLSHSSFSSQISKSIENYWCTLIIALKVDILSNTITWLYCLNTMFSSYWCHTDRFMRIERIL